jgi:hypothetical protein
MVLPERFSSHPPNGEEVMSTNNTPSLVLQQTADQKLADGLAKHEQSIPSFLVAGQSVKTEDIITILQARSASARAAEATRAAWRTAVKAARDERAKSNALVSKVKQELHLMFDGSINTLADFGLTPRKAHVVTPETKVKAAAKAKATRVARHTVGKKQRQAIKAAAPTATETPAPAPSPTVLPSTPR